VIDTEDVRWFRVEHESAVGGVRRASMALATRMGMGDARAAEIGIAVTEVATNQVKHAGGGAILLRACRAVHEAGVEVVAVDAGPGMRDVEVAMLDGHSTAGSLGIGLGAVGRLSTTWDVFTAPGRGTVLSAAFGLAGTVGEGPFAAALTRPMTGETVCGDGYALRVDDGVITATLVDGLGHGPLAARASDAAVRAFRQAPIASPAEILRATHLGLQGTRGAAAAVVRVENASATFAGIGNIGGVVADGVKHRGMVSQPGIAGANVRAFREFSYEIPSGGVVVLYSDGVTNRMRLADGPHLLRHSPLVIAATVLRDFGVHNDDASVLVVTGAGA
jgi:anti-sigma regulatory factor (Ser/Thr protein kinase)